MASLFLSGLTTAYMVFHAEGLTGIEFYYVAQMTIQPV